jgi:hypothetical protein
MVEKFLMALGKSAPSIARESITGLHPFGGIGSL